MERLIQDLFDKVCTHLLTQNRQSMMNGKNTCAYRGAGGLSCAVGCLIPDDKYDPDMEEESVDYINDRFELGFDEFEIELLMNLQFIHDQHPVEDWPSSLNKLRQKYHLDTNPLLQQSLSERGN